MLAPTLTRFACLGAWLGLLALPALVRADVAPADVCTMPGQPCTNTDPNRGDVGKKGTCKPATCTRSGVGDGGTRVPVEYECNRCVANSTSRDAGTGRDAGGGGGGGGDDDGCSVGEHGVGSSLALLGVALALLAARRRRQP